MRKQIDPIYQTVVDTGITIRTSTWKNGFAVFALKSSNYNIITINIIFISAI